MAATPIPSCSKCGATDSWQMVEIYKHTEWAYSLRPDGRWERGSEDTDELEDTYVTCGACATDLEDHSKLWKAMKERDFYWADLQK